MKIRLADNLLQKLSELGQAIDIDRQATVFGGGEVGIVEDQNEKECHNESEGTGGSAAGSWEGAAAGPRRSPCEDPRVGVVDEQAVRLDELNGLRAVYPAIIKKGDYGSWIIVTSKPLGHEGPRATFVVAYPHAREIDPKGWAFWRLGDLPKFIGPRHTNFPDASICAFGPDDGAWDRQDGPLPLVDLYSTWVVRHLYFQHFGLWPGRQHGASALYRRTEFSGAEWCGCGSGLRYRDCHEPSDKLLPEDAAREEHRRNVGSDYGPRRPPKSLIKFVRSRWSRIPSFRDVYENR